MKFTSRIRAAFLTASSALIALPATAGAQSAPAPTSYLVTVIGSSTSGPVVAHEVLVLERNGSESRVAVAGADGTVLSVPARFTPDGQIASNANDPGVTCYNMAMAVVARAHAASADPASVFLRFANSVVQVPLAVRATQTSRGVQTTALQGTSHGVFTTPDGQANAGIVVNATVEQNGDDLRGASFDEVQFIGTPDHILGHSTCVLSPAPTAPAAPASRT